MKRKLRRVCKCGHFKEQHTGVSGPNSINQWSFGECTFGSTSDGYYRFGGCRCYTYKPRILPKVVRR